MEEVFKRVEEADFEDKAIATSAVQEEGKLLLLHKIPQLILRRELVNFIGDAIQQKDFAQKKFDLLCLISDAAKALEKSLLASIELELPTVSVESY